MLFSEVYGSYYRTMSEIIGAALVKGEGISINDMREIIERYAFSESVLTIEPAIQEERWQIIKADGKTAISSPPSIPPTELELRWLKAVSLDPRFKLFDVDLSVLSNTEPLFTPDDYFVFDKYADGDPYDDPKYIENFRLIMNAIKEKRPLRIGITNRKGMESVMNVMPDHLEYSEKDDKFRLISMGHGHPITVNLARILYCRPFRGEVKIREHEAPDIGRTAVMRLTDERNALERVLLHFSHFRKRVEKTDDKHFRLYIDYDSEDETEVLIRILSFGPLLRVEGPGELEELVKKRLLMQKECGL